jgi:hypothetical protein
MNPFEDDDDGQVRSTEEILFTFQFITTFRQTLAPPPPPPPPPPPLARPTSQSRVSEVSPPSLPRSPPVVQDEKIVKSAPPVPYEAATEMTDVTKGHDSGANPIHSASFSPQSVKTTPPPTASPPSPLLPARDCTSPDSVQSTPVSRFNASNPSTLHQVTSRSVEVPSEVLNRVLLQNEEVQAEFDVFYLDPCASFSVQMFVLLTVLTLGGYAIYRAVVVMMVALRRMLCKSCIADDTVLSRGKLIATNKGRLIYWESNVKQHNNLCGYTHHEISSHTKIFNVRSNSIDFDFFMVAHNTVCCLSFRLMT